MNPVNNRPQTACIFRGVRSFLHLQEGADCSRTWMWRLQPQAFPGVGASTPASLGKYSFSLINLIAFCVHSNWENQENEKCV
jgi:hypothetical protein